MRINIPLSVFQSVEFTEEDVRAYVRRSRGRNAEKNIIIVYALFISTE